MKKGITYLLAGVMMLALLGCAAPKKTGVAGIVDDFFNSSYEYRKERPEWLDGVETEVVTEGKYIASPYQEYEKRVEYAGPIAWSEMHISGRGKIVDFTIRTEDGIVEQKAGRPYPYGYGEDLEFTFVREEVVDGVNCEVYQTFYTEELGGGLRSKETLTATVTQEYYIDMDKKQVVMVYTDLTDQVRKNGIINDIMLNDISLEQAEKNAEEDDHTTYQRLKIYNYNGDIQIEELK